MDAEAKLAEIFARLTTIELQLGLTRAAAIELQDEIDQPDGDLQSPMGIASSLLKDAIDGKPRSHPFSEEIAVALALCGALHKGNGKWDPPQGVSTITLTGTPPQFGMPLVYIGSEGVQKLREDIARIQAQFEAFSSCAATHDVKRAIDMAREMEGSCSDILFGLRKLQFPNWKR